MATTKAGTPTRNMANGMPCSNQLSHRIIQQLSCVHLCVDLVNQCLGCVVQWWWNCSLDCITVQQFLLWSKATDWPVIQCIEKNNLQSKFLWQASSFLQARYYEVKKWVAFQQKCIGGSLKPNLSRQVFFLGGRGESNFSHYVLLLMNDVIGYCFTSVMPQTL